MFSNTTRIVLLIIGLLVAVYCALIGRWLPMSAALIFSFFIVLGYFLNGTVFLAMRKLSTNDFDEAETLLKMTRYPKYLAATQKAYYSYTAGLIEAKKGNFILAANFLEDAMKKGLKTTHDKTVACLNISQICYALNNREKATQFLNEAKRLNQNTSLQPEIDRLEALLK